MDLTPIFNQAWEVFGVLIPVAILLCLIKTPWFKGIVGELIVNLSAKFMLDKKVYNLIKNVTLPTEDGTTQIDHIIISRYGVFVVETKNMKGWIFGSPNQKTWTQKIYKHSSKFQNPLHQNYKHVKTLESLLELNPEQIHSVIVFVGDSTFKTPMPENVTYGFGYAKFIKSKTNPVLSEGQVENIVSHINGGRLARSFKTNRDHVRHVKKIVAAKENTPPCPKCGNPMVMREVKRGQNKGKQFWGCANYPKCRGTVNI